MDTRLIAKVLVTTKNGTRRIGTGYPVSKTKQLLITARHVVCFPERDMDKKIGSFKI